MRAHRKDLRADLDQIAEQIGQAIEAARREPKIEIIPADWVVQRIRIDQRRVAIELPTNLSSAAGVAKLRSLFPEFLAQPPGELLASFKEAGRLDLGVLPGRKAYPMRKLLESHGFTVSVEDASETHLFPTNEKLECVLKIRDRNKREAFCEDLIARGARVEEGEG